MKLLSSIQFLSLVCLGVFTLLILGAEPNNPSNYSEDEMNRTLITLGSFWVGLLVTFITSTTIIYFKNKRC
jgi:hypothetical protein